MVTVNLFKSSFTKRVVAFFSISVGGAVYHADAQYLSGQSHSNYSGIHGVYINPANVADSRYKVQIHLAGYENYAYNNYLVWEAPYSVFGLMTNTVPSKYRGRSNGIIFKDQEYLREKLNGRNKHIRVGAEVRGPGLLVNLNDKNAISVNTRLRVGGAVTHTSESVARLLRNGTSSENVINPEDFGNSLHANTNGLIELSATYGRVLLEEEDSFWKVGITAKRLIGVHQGHIHANSIDYAFVQDPQNPRRSNILIKNIDGRYGITDDAAFQTISISPQWLLGNASPGGGYGADIGLVYEYRPDYRKYAYREKGKVQYDASKNKYEYRVSVSLLDVGWVRYRNPAYVNAYQLVRQNQILDENYFAEMDGTDGFIQAINQTLSATEGDRVLFYRAMLPTRLQVNVDYKVKEKVYVNAMLMHGLVSNKSIAFTMPSMLAVTPRYETKWLEVAIPISLTDNYSRLAVGVGARLGILYLGSDNILSTFNIGNPKGMEFYFGAQIPIFRKPPESSLKCYPEEKKRGIFGFLKKR